MHQTPAAAPLRDQAFAQSAEPPYTTRMYSGVGGEAARADPYSDLESSSRVTVCLATGNRRRGSMSAAAARGGTSAAVHLSSASWARTVLLLVHAPSGTDRCPCAFRSVALGLEPSLCHAVLPFGAILLLVVGARDTIHG
jgi:hypothetical protein